MDAPFPDSTLTTESGKSNPSFLKRWRLWLVAGGVIIVSASF